MNYLSIIFVTQLFLAPLAANGDTAASATESYENLHGQKEREVNRTRDYVDNLKFTKELIGELAEFQKLKQHPEFQKLLKTRATAQLMRLVGNSEVKILSEACRQYQELYFKCIEDDIKNRSSEIDENIVVLVRGLKRFHTGTRDSRTRDTVEKHIIECNERIEKMCVNDISEKVKNDFLLNIEDNYKLLMSTGKYFKGMGNRGVFKERYDAICAEVALIYRDTVSSLLDGKYKDQKTEFISTFIDFTKSFRANSITDSLTRTFTDLAAGNYSMLGNLYLNEKEYDKASEAFISASAMHIRLGDRELAAAITKKAGDVKQITKMVDMLTAIEKKSSKSQKDFKTAGDICIQLQDYLKAAKYYDAAGDPEAAKLARIAELSSDEKGWNKDVTYSEILKAAKHIESLSEDNTLLEQLLFETTSRLYSTATDSDDFIIKKTAEIRLMSLEKRLSTIAVVASKPRKATIHITCDNEYKLFVNGRQIGADTTWTSLEKYDVELRRGDVVTVMAKDVGPGKKTAGFFCCIVFSDKEIVPSGQDWCYTLTPDASFTTSRSLDRLNKADPHNIASAHIDRKYPGAKGCFVWSKEPAAVVYFKYVIR